MTEYRLLRLRFDVKVAGFEVRIICVSRGQAGFVCSFPGLDLGCCWAQGLGLGSRLKSSCGLGLAVWLGVRGRLLFNIIFVSLGLCIGGFLGSTCSNEL